MSSSQYPDDRKILNDSIVLDHGGGGRKSRNLVRSIFLSRFGSTTLDTETDAAIVDIPGKHPAARGRIRTSGQIPARLAITTDAHVVKPLFFPGGDIGRLAICGTVNDLAVSGARPLYLTASFIIEEGFPVGDLERIADSMAAAAVEAGIRIVAGDTKVVEAGACDGLFISTSGVGTVPPDRASIAEAVRVESGDVILVNGPIGDHGAAIACARNGIQTEPPLHSDCAALSGLIDALYGAGVIPHFMRDATRGGLGTVLCELAEMRRVVIELEEPTIPVRDTVRGVCEMYGFDPLYLANEGTMMCVVGVSDADTALGVMTGHPSGRNAAVIGAVSSANAVQPLVTMNTAIGGRRIVRMLSGEQLPRIC